MAREIHLRRRRRSITELLTPPITSLIDNGFNSGGTKTGWHNGDFNYDGVINGDDYTLIDNAFNTQGSVSFAGVSAGPAEMIATNTDQIAVPEPGTFSLIAIGAMGCLTGVVAAIDL